VQEESNNILLIGVGNEFRGDDALGVYVSREVQRRHFENVRVIEESGEGAALMERVKESSRVFIVDAVRSGEPAGTVHRIEPGTMRVPKKQFFSSHSFGVAEALEMAKRLSILPETCVLYGIEGESFEQGEGLSMPVVKSLPELMSLIELDLNKANHYFESTAGATR
jgi:hydrogenase maturation protease